MKAKLFYLTLLIALLTTLSMAQNRNDKLIQQVLAKQLDAGCELDFYAAKYNIDDVKAASDCLYNYFASKGYTPPTAERFDSLVFSIFGAERDSPFSIGNLTLVEKSGNFCEIDTTMAFGLLEVGDNDYYYIDWENRLMLEAHFLPELIDYQAAYPDLAKIEDEPNIIVDHIEERTFEVRRWRDDLPYLKSKREKILQLELMRNRYLFGDRSKADIAWLRQNNNVFNLKLVRNFGYDADSALNATVFYEAFRYYDNYRGDYRKRDERYMAEAFYHFDCAGKLHIHSGMFDYVLIDWVKEGDRHIESSRTRNVHWCFGHLRSAALEVYFDKTYFYKPIRIEDKARIICAFAQLEVDAHEKGGRYYEGIGYDFIDPDIFEEARRNGFYGRDFKNVVRDMLENYDKDFDREHSLIYLKPEYRYMLQDFVGLPRK